MKGLPFGGPFIFKPSFQGRTMTFKDWIWPLIASSSYIVGGFLTFGGVALILFMRGEDFMGLGQGHTLGYLFVCVGLIMTILGVLIMRILRNRI
jgi:hypothetical protein